MHACNRFLYTAQIMGTHPAKTSLPPRNNWSYMPSSINTPLCIYTGQKLYVILDARSTNLGIAARRPSHAKWWVPSQAGVLVNHQDRSRARSLNPVHPCVQRRLRLRRRCMPFPAHRVPGGRACSMVSASQSRPRSRQQLSAPFVGVRDQ
jgi:hypothetical protein